MDSDLQSRKASWDGHVSPVIASGNDAQEALPGAKVVRVGANRRRQPRRAGAFMHSFVTITETLRLLVFAATLVAAVLAALVIVARRCGLGPEGEEVQCLT